jgi:hypothetical protein
LSLADTLIGGGLSLAGAAGALVYNGRRERAAASAARTEAKAERQRVILLELQDLLTEVMLTSIQIGRGGAPRDVWAHGRVIARLTSLAPRVQNQEIRQLIVDHADHLSVEYRRMKDEEMQALSNSTANLVSTIGAEIRRLET